MGASLVGAWEEEEEHKNSRRWLLGGRAEEGSRTVHATTVAAKGNGIVMYE